MIGNINIEQLLVLINSVDDEASVKYSRVTGRFYVSTKILYLHEKNYCTCNEHMFTVNDAIISFYRTIQGKDLVVDRKTRRDGVYRLPELVK